MFVSCQYDVTAVELRQEYAETRKRYKKLIKSSRIFETDCPLVRDREKMIKTIVKSFKQAPLLSISI